MNTLYALLTAWQLAKVVLRVSVSVMLYTFTELFFMYAIHANIY